MAMNITSNLVKNHRKRFTAIVLLCSFSIVNFIYVSTTLGYSKVPTQWGAGSAYGRNYIVNEGHLPSHESTYFWDNTLKSYGGEDPLSKILASIINIVVGVTEYPALEVFHHTFSWMGLIAIPLIAIAFYYYWQGTITDKPIQLGLLYLFAALPLTSLNKTMAIGLSASNTAPRFLFLSFIFLFIRFSNSVDKRDLLMLFTIVTALFLYHHTWAYYTLIYMVPAAFATGVFKNKEVGTKLVGYSLLLFITTVVFLNIRNILEVTAILRSSPVNLSEITDVFRGFSGENSGIPLQYSEKTNFYHWASRINVVSMALIVPLFLLSSIYIYIKEGRENINDSLIFLLAGTSLVASALFVMNGLSGLLGRIFESVTYLNVAVIGYLLSKREYIHLLSISLVIIIVITSSVSTYGLYQDQDRQLTYEEAAAIETIGTHLKDDSRIFSDFRLGTPFIFYGTFHLEFVDSSSASDEEIRTQLANIYYEPDGPPSSLENAYNNETYLVVVSTTQSKVGILDTSLSRYQPPTDIKEKWDQQSGYHKVYDSSTLSAYRRT